MKTNGLRNFNYDAARERALALRSQAIGEMFGAAAAWLATLIARIGGRARRHIRGSAPCAAADC